MIIKNKQFDLDLRIIANVKYIGLPYWLVYHRYGWNPYTKHVNKNESK